MKIDSFNHSSDLSGPEKRKINLLKKQEVAKKDILEISNQAKHLKEPKLKSDQTVREKDVNQIRANLNLGLYEKHEYKEITANKLVHSQELKDIVYDLESLKETDLTEDRVEKIGQIKHKLATGFYDRADVLQKIAEKLIKEFGFE